MGGGSFTHPKPKTNQVCSQSEFIYLSKQFKFKPYQMNNINELLFKL